MLMSALVLTQTNLLACDTCFKYDCILLFFFFLVCNCEIEFNSLLIQTVILVIILLKKIKSFWLKNQASCNWNKNANEQPKITGVDHVKWTNCWFKWVILCTKVKLCLTVAIIIRKIKEHRVRPVTEQLTSFANIYQVFHPLFSQYMCLVLRLHW